MLKTTRRPSTSDVKTASLIDCTRTLHCSSGLQEWAAEVNGSTHGLTCSDSPDSYLHMCMKGLRATDAQSPNQEQRESCMVVMASLIDI